MIRNIESILNIEIRDKSNDEETRKSLIEAKYDYYSMFEHNFNMPGYEEFKKQIMSTFWQSISIVNCIRSTSSSFKFERKELGKEGKHLSML